jgi:S-adenosylhomocysteine hydrolase
MMVDPLTDACPVNMVADDGQPTGVMDVAFANHALVAEYLVKDRSSLPRTFSSGESCYGSPGAET